MFSVGANVKRFLRLFLGIGIWSTVGFCLLHISNPIMGVVNIFGGSGVVLVFLLLLNIFVILILIRIYKYLKELFVLKKLGTPRKVLIKECFIRLGFLWVIFALLQISVWNGYKQGIEKYFECSSDTHVFKGKEYEVQVCEGIQYDKGFATIRRLNVWDKENRLLVTRDFIDETTAYSEVGNFHIVYLEDKIEYGYAKDNIHFPPTWWDRVTANLPFISINQFAQYLNSR